MAIIDPKADAYSSKFSSPEPKLLQEIAELSSQGTQGHMLSGHVQGRFLEMISVLLKPERILEIGSFLGYSGICLARGLAPNGLLHTIESRETDADLAEGFFREAGLLDKIRIHRGNAMDIIPGLGETWDLVFIDADKTNYYNYYKQVMPHLKRGGLIIADNVLFHGQVLENPVKGKNAKAIQSFNELVLNDPGVECVMLTVRDGLLLIRKN